MIVRISLAAGHFLRGISSAAAFWQDLEAPIKTFSTVVEELPVKRFVFAVTARLGWSAYHLVAVTDPDSARSSRMEISEGQESEGEEFTSAAISTVGKSGLPIDHSSTLSECCS